ncbi:MAG TPA: cyclic-di-AMP receptor [Chloroflexota bacterium]|nr:cyclic-di-AMP receptor [Chloroflexota bacterium]
MLRSPPAPIAALPALEIKTQGMRLLLAIVGEEDAHQVTAALADEGFRVTRLKTAGGLLRKRSETLLIGTEAEQVPAALRVLERTCRERTEYALPAMPEALIGAVGLAPMEVSVGGATVFVLPVAQLVRV